MIVKNLADRFFIIKVSKIFQLDIIFIAIQNHYSYYFYDLRLNLCYVNLFPYPMYLRRNF